MWWIFHCVQWLCLHILGSILSFLIWDNYKNDFYKCWYMHLLTKSSTWFKTWAYVCLIVWWQTLKEVLLPDCKNFLKWEWQGGLPSLWRECLGSPLSAVVGGTLLWICSITGRGCHLIVFLCNSSWTVILSIFSCAYLPLYVSLFFCSVPNSSMLLNKIKKSVHPALFLSLEEIFSFLPFSITLTTCHT